MEERGRVEGELALALAEGKGEVVDAMVAPWRRVMCVFFFVFFFVFLMLRVVEEWLTGAEIFRG